MSIPSDLELRFLLLCRALELPEPVAEYQFALEQGRRFRFDFCWVPLRVAVEIEGGTWQNGRHSREPGFSNDCRKYNMAAALGWAVFRFTAAMLDNNETAALEETLRERSTT